MRALAAARLAALGLLLAAPAGASAQAGVSYQVPPDNPFVGQPGAAPELFAYGLRNPFRFSFDRQTGAMLIGDVGGSQREEVDLLPAPGANFGWPCREGKLAGPVGCTATGAVDPIFDYAEPSPRAITGGFVVRDPSLPTLAGRYLYADFYDGDIRSIPPDASAPGDDRSTGALVSTLAGFGEDAAGRLYAADLVGGGVYRLIAASTPGALQTQLVAGFSAPMYVTSLPGDASRLFVVERAGRLQLRSGAATSEFLDIANQVSAAGEGGMSTVAFAPDYASSGKLYVFYTDLGGDIRVDEFRRSDADANAVDPASRRSVLTIEHSSESNHYGGQLQFGRDGCLYVSTGDGGGQNDEHGNGQNLSTLLGKLLRIDPDPPGVGGPVCGSQASGGGGQTPAGTAPTTTRDTQAPGLRTRVPRRQRVLRRRGAVGYARCSEQCTVSMSATLVVRGRAYPLRRAGRTVPAGRRATLKARLSGRAARALRRALRRGRRARVRVGLRARDAAGNRSRLVRATVRVLR